MTPLYIYTNEVIIRPMSTMLVLLYFIPGQL